MKREETGDQRQLHAWDRSARGWDLLFWATLGYPTVRTLVDGTLPWGSRAVTVVLAGGLAVAHYLIVVRRRHWCEEHPWAAGGYLAAVGLAYAVLLTRDSQFLFFVYGLYPLLFQLVPLRIAAVLAAALTLGTLAWAQGLQDLWGDPAALLSVLGSTLLAVTIGLFIQAIARQSEQRSLAIAELEAVRDELARSGRASAALVAARSPADVMEALGRNLGGGVTQVMLLDGGREAARWGESDGRWATTVPVAGGERWNLRLKAPHALPERILGAWGNIAPQVALALRNLELVERARDAGVLEERQRLAREIHDTLAQGFASIVLQLEAAEQALPGAPATVAQHLDIARRTARESLGDVRRSVQDMRPEPLEDTPLPQALQHVATAWSTETGVAASTTTTGTPRPLHPEVEVTLLRAAQEGLANARKHARAQHVAVTLSYMDALAMLDVRDDGRGFDPRALVPDGDGVSGGYGLTALRERLTRLGGELEVESGPGQGTTLVARIPLEEAG